MWGWHIVGARASALLCALVLRSLPFSAPRMQETLIRQTELASPFSSPPNLSLMPRTPDASAPPDRTERLHFFSVFEPHPSLSILSFSLWLHLPSAPPASRLSSQSALRRSDQATLACPNPFLAPPHLQGQVQAPWAGGWCIHGPFDLVKLPFLASPQYTFPSSHSKPPGHELTSMPVLGQTQVIEYEFQLQWHSEVVLKHGF